MITKTPRGKSTATRAIIPRAGRFLVGALIVALILSGWVGVPKPRVSAQEISPSSFPSERAAVEYFVALQAASRSGIGVWSVATDLLAANPELIYSRDFEVC